MTAAVADARLCLPATAESVAVARQLVAGICDALDVPERLAGDVKLATTEACTNAVVHAYPDGARSMDVEVFVRQEELIVIVRDHGVGIAPRTGPRGLGLGLPLIAALCSRVAIQEAPGGGTEVVMTFALDGDEADGDDEGTPP